MGLIIGNGIGIPFNKQSELLSSYWTKQTAGLIYKTDFDSLTGFVNDGTFSNVASDALVCFNPLPIKFTRTLDGIDWTGVREATIFKENGTLYLIYDGGNGIVGWYNQYASSTDGGRTWTKLGIFGPSHDKGTGGSYLGVGMGYLYKEGNTYYLYRLTTNNLAGSPYFDVPAEPYLGDIWKATSIAGPWTWVMDLTDLGGWNTSQTSGV